MLRLFSAFFAVLLVSLLPNVLDAQQIDDYLQAGEFGPAISAAKELPAPARDAALAQIAVSQSSMASRDAGLRTAANIFDDSTRGQTFDRINGGGAAQADFDSLMDLIQSTVQPETWADAGGPGNLAPFEGGVYVDASGLLQRRTVEAESDWLEDLRVESEGPAQSGVRSNSPLRKVSLTRLERAVQHKLAAGQPLDEDMLVMAGLMRVQYVMVYPETKDIVLVGPAGDWTTDAEGRVVNRKYGHPVVHLDDLVDLLREFRRPDHILGCSIEPRRDNLQAAHAYLAGKEPPKRLSARHAYLDGLRDAVGQQDIRIFGVPAGSRGARVLVEADYLMKLVGLGLADSAAGLENYLDRLPPPGQGAPDSALIRWWFTFRDKDVVTNADRNAFAFSGQAVQLLTENEFFDQQGQRHATGKAAEANREFARDFTQLFPELSKKHHIFAELQNLFDLSLVAAIIAQEDLATQIDWQMPVFGPEGAYHTPRSESPKSVESIVAHQVVRGKGYVAAVSGGVRISPSMLLEDGIQVTEDDALGSHRVHGSPRDDAFDRWWWD